MNGILDQLQQVFDLVRTQAAALWNTGSAIIANRPEPARTVVIYTLVLIALAFVVPKIVKLVSK